MEHVEAGRVGQVHVENQEVGNEVLDRVERFVPVAGFGDFEALAFETVAHQTADHLVVVDDEDPHRSRSGRDCNALFRLHLMPIDGGRVDLVIGAVAGIREGRIVTRRQTRQLRPLQGGAGPCRYLRTPGWASTSEESGG